MKTLSLLRHAKSSWADANQKDFARTLNERGLRTAPRVGRWLREKNIKPDLIIASPAERARLTVELVAQSAKWNVMINFDERLYLASVPTLLDVVRGVDEKVKHLMLVGHNPGLEELCLCLYMTHEPRSFPTAAFASIKLRAETWNAIGASSNRLTQFLIPRTLDEN